MKMVHLATVDDRLEVATGSCLLDGLLARQFELELACGGNGLCATCHVHVLRGHDSLSPRTAREERTLALIVGANESTRLACQCHILGEGIVVDLPEGIYAQSAQSIEGLIGTKATQDYLHPINSKVLIGKGKIITRTMLQVFRALSEELRRLREDI